LRGNVAYARRRGRECATVWGLDVEILEKDGMVHIAKRWLPVVHPLRRHACFFCCWRQRGLPWLRYSAHQQVSHVAPTGRTSAAQYRRAAAPWFTLESASHHILHPSICPFDVWVVSGAATKAVPSGSLPPIPEAILFDATSSPLTSITKRGYKQREHLVLVRSSQKVALRRADG
jgi:hypothetical protein